MTIKKVFLLSMLVLTTACFANDEFIIKSDDVRKTKKMSKNELKENIGQATKDAFNVSSVLGSSLGQLQQTVASLQTCACTKSSASVKNFQEFLQALGHLSLESGRMQVTLANIQQHFSQVVERLVDNKAPFKKAKPGDLNEALSVVQKIYNQLNVEISSCKKIASTIKDSEDKQLENSIKAVRDAGAKLVSLNSELQKSKDLLNNSKCLKLS